jgi:cyanophycinase
MVPADIRGRLAQMPGPVALVGAGEFTPAMAQVDADLLAATGRDRPRVVVVPTASFPDGEVTFRRWADRGTDHFTALGAEVEAVLLRGRADADDEEHVQAISEADVIYFSGGKPEYLLRALQGTPAWDAVRAAHERGAVLAGCSAGAMVLAGRQVEMRGGRLPFPLRWRTALGVVAGVAIIPHYDRFPEPLAALVVLQAPRGLAILGIDEETALVGRDGAWQVQGRGRVTIWCGRSRTRHRAGETFRL